MSQYLILIYGQEADYDLLTDERIERIRDGHTAFGTKFGAAILGGNALQPPSTATTVCEDGADGFTVTDGPFAESKEALGGYYVVEAADLDAAIAMAREIPTVNGGVEVRPIRVLT